MTIGLFDLTGKVALVVLTKDGELEDYVGPAVFLASAASDFITGQILYVDGGVTTW